MQGAPRARPGPPPPSTLGRGRPPQGAVSPSPGSPRPPPWCGIALAGNTASLRCGLGDLEVLSSLRAGPGVRVTSDPGTSCCASLHMASCLEAASRFRRVPGPQPSRLCSGNERKKCRGAELFPGGSATLFSLLTFFFPATVHVQYYSMSLRRAARRSDIYMIYGAPTSPAPARHCTVTALQPARSLCRTLCWTPQLALEEAPESSASAPLARILSHGCTQLQGRSGVARHLAQPRPATGPGAWSGGALWGSLRPHGGRCGQGPDEAPGPLPSTRSQPSATRGQSALPGWPRPVPPGDAGKALQAAGGAAGGCLSLCPGAMLKPVVWCPGRELRT